VTPDQINELVDDCIDDLCDDNAEQGAGSLIELAHIFARAGMPQSSFMNMREFIINSAIERLGTAATSFIHYKLQVAEQDAKKTRLLNSGAKQYGTIYNRH
jgi:hypothetical protein